MILHKPLYLDNMATTPADPRVVEAMQICLTSDNSGLDNFGNPSSQHHFGKHAFSLICKAREQVARLINADPCEIIWTSGATESINLALKGVANFYKRQGNHIITLSTEHKAVLDSCRYLESQGFEVTYLNPARNGLLDIELLKNAILPTTILASFMHVNNETGVIQNIEEIGRVLREKGVWFHVDAAQSAGKILIDLKKMPIDLLSLTAHKIYGPKGIGALYVRRHPKVQLIAQIHGGDQENKLRSGTLPTHQIVGMGMAYEIAEKNAEEEMLRVTTLRNLLWKNLSQLPGIHINGDLNKCIGGCLNISIDDINAELLLKNLSDVAISTGSACNSVDPEPSHVLLAMGLSREAANRSFRISIGRFTTQKDILQASERIVNEVSRLRLRYEV